MVEVPVVPYLTVSLLVARFLLSFFFHESALAVGSRTGNLKRHLARAHLKEYEAVLKKEEEKSSTAGKVPAVITKGTKQRSIQQFYNSEKVAVTMNSASFRDAIVRMVVKEGIAIRFFSSDTFKLMNGEMAQKLAVSLDADSIKKYVMDAARNLKLQIQQELAGKLVYVKLDCCTRIQTNYLGVNVRYIDQKTNAPVTKTLSVSDTLSRHTGRELKTILQDILDSFGIPIANVLCCVTDNASNMVKMVKELKQDLAAAANANATPTSSSSISHTSSNDSDSEESAELEPDISSCDREDDLDNILPTISHGRCAAHTLQLAIGDGLKGGHASALIGMFFS
jgi:hypothetical protein